MDKQLDRILFQSFFIYLALALNSCTASILKYKGFCLCILDKYFRMIELPRIVSKCNLD